MKLKREIKFYDKVSAPASGEVIRNNLGGSVLQLDITGTGFEIQVEGLVSYDSVFRNVCAISDTTYDSFTSITTPGFYKVDISGYRAYKVNLIKVSGEVTCIGLEV